MPILANFVYIFSAISVEKGLKYTKLKKIATEKIQKVKNL